MQAKLKWIILALAAQIIAVYGITVPREIHGEKQIVKLRFMDSDSQGRYRRSTTAAGEVFEFPKTLTFTLSINGSDVTLSLQLNDMELPDAPVYTIREDKVVKDDIPYTNSYALYQDVNKRAAYIVSCDGPTQEHCELHGSFYHNNKRYHMTPHKTGDHELTETNVTDVRHFGDDGRLPPEHIRNENRRSGNEPEAARPKNIRAANIVELLIVTDEEVYRQFRAKTNSQSAAVAAMVTYYKLIVNEMDLHYLSVPMVDSSLNIRVMYAGIVYAITGDRAPWSRDNTQTYNGRLYLSAQNALNSFTSWRNQIRNDLTPHDHAMAFTMKDFEFISNGRPSSRGLAGQAWLNQVCRTWDTSITEDDSFRTANTAAHELGHSLGASHDQSSECPTNNLNIMTPSLYGTVSADKAAAQWTFSRCSVRGFRTHLSNLRTNCMKDHSIPDSDFDLPKTLPGETFSFDQQCKMYLGDGATGCSTVSAESCYRGARCCRSGSSSTYYPMAGTTCGTNKWCYRGECVTRKNEPPTVNYCKEKCCVERRKGTRCCKGQRCCKRKWGKNLDCCLKCQKAIE